MGHVNLVESRRQRQRHQPRATDVKGVEGSNKDHWLGRRAHVAVLSNLAKGRSWPQSSQPSAGNWMRHTFFLEAKPLRDLALPPTGALVALKWHQR